MNYTDWFMILLVFCLLVYSNRGNLSRKDLNTVGVYAYALCSRDFKVCHLGGVVACILTLLYMYNVSIVHDWTSFKDKGIRLDEHRYLADGCALSASFVSLFAGDTTTTLKAMYGVALIAMGGCVCASSYINTFEGWTHMTAFRFLPYMGSAVTNTAELRGNYTPVWVFVTVVHVLLLHVARHIVWEAGQSVYKPAGGWTTRVWSVLLFMPALYYYTEPDGIVISAFCDEDTDPRFLHQVSMCVKGCVVAGLHGFQIYLTSSGEGVIAEEKKAPPGTTNVDPPRSSAAIIAAKKRVQGLKFKIDEEVELAQLETQVSELTEQLARLTSPRGR